MGKLMLLIAILIFAGFGIFYYTQTHRQENPNFIALSGNIETTEVDVSFKIAGRVEKRLVTEGDLVKAGQEVALLDSIDLQHERDLRQAEVQNAEASLLELEAGYLPEEIAQAAARVQQSEAELIRIKDEFNRQQKLYRQEVISAREFEASQSSYRVALARFEEAAKYLRLLEKGTRPEKIDQAVAKLKQAQQNLLIAETRLSYATLASPLSGVVLSKNVEPGEYVTAGAPIVTVGDLDHVWMRGYVSETDLGKIKLGQGVDVTNDSYPDRKYEGRIVFISQEAEFTPKNIQTEKERVKLVYRIKVDIANPNWELKPGMPVDGLINIDSIQQDQNAHRSDEKPY